MVLKYEMRKFVQLSGHAIVITQTDKTLYLTRGQLVARCSQKPSTKRCLEASHLPLFDFIIQPCCNFFVLKKDSIIVRLGANNPHVALYLYYKND